MHIDRLHAKPPLFEFCMVYENYIFYFLFQLNCVMMTVMILKTKIDLKKKGGGEWIDQIEISVLLIRIQCFLIGLWTPPLFVSG